MTGVVQSFSGSFCTLNYDLEGYTEGIMEYHNCIGQFHVNFTVSPHANFSNTTTNSVTQCNITNLERCEVYNIAARSYRGGQLMDTVNASDSVMTSKLCMASCRAWLSSKQCVKIDLESKWISQWFWKQIYLFFCKYCTKGASKVCTCVDSVGWYWKVHDEMSKDNNMQLLDSYM